MTRSLLLILCIAACALGYRAALAENVDAQAERITAVVMGTTMGVFFHEFAHAMIGELELPATGPEEDVADEFSAYMMANMVQGKADSFLIDVARYSSLHLFYSAQEKARDGRPHPWQDEHAPDIRRFRHFFCMLYGADPPLFGGLADQVRFGQSNKGRCLNDYRRSARAWDTLLRLRARNLGPDLPGTHPADAPGGRIILNFSPTYYRYGSMARRLFDEFLGEWLQEMSRQLVWPRNLLVEFRDCGEPNAFYSPSYGIRMCHELIERASQTVFQAEGLATLTPGMPATAFVKGDWWARMNTKSGLLDITITYSPDQTYISNEIWTQSGNLAARVTGVWSAQSAGLGQLMIHRNPTQFHPREFCNSLGYCRPHARQPANYQARIINRNTMNVGGVVWTRIR